jgi:hypothetical protein
MKSLSGVVDALWDASDATERWRAHAVVQDVLEGLGLKWLGLIDADPREVMAVLRDSRTRREAMVELVCRQVDRGGTTIGLDVERMTEHRELAARVQRVLELRRREMEAVEVSVSSPEEVDLSALWLTADGQSVLRWMRLGRTCTPNELDRVREALSERGISLKVGKARLERPESMSEPVGEYVLRLADR